MSNEGLNLGVTEEDIPQIPARVASAHGVVLSDELSEEISKAVVNADVRLHPRVFWNQRVKTSPLYEMTRERGATCFAPYCGVWLPYGYDTPENEYWCLTNNVTMWDVGVEQIIEITGPDAERLMDYIIPRRMDMEDEFIGRVLPGRCAYVILCDGQGGILNDPVLVRLAKNHFWLALADNPMFEMIKAVRDLKSFDAQVTKPDVHAMQVQGPYSRMLMCDLFGEYIREMKYYDSWETELNGIPVVVASTGWSTELGYEIYLRDGSRGTELWKLVEDAGQPYEIAPIGPSQIRRMIAGLLNYGCPDMTEENSPFEVYEPNYIQMLLGLRPWKNLRGVDYLDVDFTQVRFKKADFRGKEALQRIAKEGVSHRLVGVEISGDRIPIVMNERVPWRVFRNRRHIGDTTSATYAPDLGKNIAYAHVPIEHASRGTRLQIEIPEEGRRRALIVQKPFYDIERIKARS